MPVHSSTFIATSNKVFPSRPRQAGKSTKQVMEEHEAFKCAFGASSKRPPFRLPSSHGAAANIIQCSSPNEEVVSCKAGFVSVVLNAYNMHHHMVLRPDDVWQAVLVQFNCYLKARSEELRDKVVDFQGQKALMVRSYGNLFSTDFGEIAIRMANDITGNIKDPDLVAWLLPSFTTTTSNDLMAASVTAMSTMQKYFKYKFQLRCGIPSVTLLGTPQDWAELRSKIDRLLTFELVGQSHMKEWHGWLTFIADNFLASAQGSPDLKFWDQVACHCGGGSGPSYVSGWISVFSVWSEKGEWQGARRKVQRMMQAPFTSDFPIIDTNDLTSGCVSVPVLVDDNGKEYDCVMLAGQFGMRVDGDTVSPATDWCIATKTTKK